jgi:hypothetical protein
MSSKDLEKAAVPEHVAPDDTSFDISETVEKDLAGLRARRKYEVHS